MEVEYCVHRRDASSRLTSGVVVEGESWKAEKKRKALEKEASEKV